MFPFDFHSIIILPGEIPYVLDMENSRKTYGHNDAEKRTYGNNSMMELSSYKVVPHT